MSICAAVFPPHTGCPENLKSFNKDGSRIDPDDEKTLRPQSELGSQKVLNATLEAAKAKSKRSDDGNGIRPRKGSVDSGLSGDTLKGDEDERKKGGLLRKIVGHRSGNQGLD